MSTTLKPRTGSRQTVGMSTSDLDAYLAMYHAGELTKYETGLLKAILRKTGESHLLNRKHAKNFNEGPLLARYNLVTGEVVVLVP